MRQSRVGCRGVALIAALWSIVLLTLLGTAISVVSMELRRSSKNYLTAVVSEALADSAIRLILLRISEGVEESRPGVGVQSIQLNNQVVNVVVSRESGRIDLNSASFVLLQGLFVTNGVDELEASQLAARIMDWRDPDSDRSTNGAESAEYLLSDFSYGPRNDKFEAIDEVRQVLGVYAFDTKLLSSITVYSGLETPTAIDASPLVVAALKWAEQHDLNLSPGSWEDRETSEESMLVEAKQGRQKLQAGDVIRLQACVPRQPTTNCRTTIARLTGSSSKPVQILMWGADVLL